MLIDRVEGLALVEALKARKAILQSEYDKHLILYQGARGKDRDMALALVNHWGGRLDEAAHWLQLLCPDEELVPNLLNEGGVQIG